MFVNYVGHEQAVRPISLDKDKSHLLPVVSIFVTG